ncbi:MAG: hypothetical protein Unbinned834contig1000_3 [Prokaryotic dsDNA virus sp.]|nr:MAG: hypothetical protein Unbinned834contig1000_3 [Prokaryotic dsDNA virus sp.]|tara:strand:- start:23114 stop:24193 length:1080 start_codon:yes stop_codon:yes gene_type:complete
MIGRFTEDEVKDLKSGLDFREPKYRREVFLRFYEFHLKYKAHPGAVYYMFPFFFEKFKMNMEQKLWFVYINGCTQNVVTTYIIFKKFPDLHSLDINELKEWFRKYYLYFGWDIDRRYHKNSFELCVEDYKNHVGKSQEEFFNSLLGKDKHDGFKQIWDYVLNKFYTFGRLSSFSYIEYLWIAGLNIDCDNLFLEDITGSKSHRNGLCKVLGRDDYDWNKNDVVYPDEFIEWLKKEAEILLNEAKERINHPQVSYFTLESTLCCYKGWHRVNRRYPNVYNDMFYDRIRYAESRWGKIFDCFWEARKKYLPRHLRLEDNSGDIGLNKVKQNHYRKTGQVIMMNEEWSCFDNDYNKWVEQRQ